LKEMTFDLPVNSIDDTDTEVKHIEYGFGDTKMSTVRSMWKKQDTFTKLHNSKDHKQVTDNINLYMSACGGKGSKLRMTLSYFLLGEDGKIDHAYLHYFRYWFYGSIMQYQTKCKQPFWTKEFVELVGDSVGYDEKNCKTWYEQALSSWKERNRIKSVLTKRPMPQAGPKRKQKKKRKVAIDLT